MAEVPAGRGQGVFMDVDVDTIVCRHLMLLGFYYCTCVFGWTYQRAYALLELTAGKKQ